MKVLIGCDVDPILPLVLDRRPQGDIWECLDRIDVLLQRIGSPLPRITWLIRADQSVEFSTGSFLSAYTHRRNLWDRLQQREHELGWHMHTMSYSEAHKEFVFDPDPAWLTEAHEQIASCFPVRATRTGWDYGSNTLLAALDRLGVAVDFSALPGNVLWFSVGKVKLRTDWRTCPVNPYRPSRSDYQRPGSDCLSLWEVPAAQFRHSLNGALMRGLLRLRHGYFSFSGANNLTRVLTDEWRELPHFGDDICGLFFHPYDLADTGIRNFAANLNRLQGLPNVEFVTASEAVAWLSSREEMRPAQAGKQSCSRS